MSSLPPDDVLDRLLSKAKLKLFYQKGAAFLGSLMCNTKFEWDDNIPTAATDGDTIFWNRKFFYSIPVDERAFVLAHELWHIAYQHCARLGARNPQIWNIAADHVINCKLIKENYSVENLGFSVYQDMRFHEMNVDEVYSILNQNPPPPSSNQGLSDDIKPADASKALDQIGKLVGAVQASKMAGEVGVVPGEIEELIDRFLNPILPWEVLIQQFLVEMINDDYSYRKPSRRYEDIIMPSMWNEGGLQELNWYVDVSGSITPFMIKRFFSELYYVKQVFNPAKMNIIQFDTRITSVTELENEDSFDSIKISGRGGTDLSPVHDHIMKTKPNAAIIFSDMECSPMEYTDIPVLWAIFGHKRGGAHEPNFGQIVRIIE